jgi:membrane-associated phospholipid phosphatase
LKQAIDFLWALSKIRSPFLDTLIQLITRLGEELIIFGVICLFYWCISKSVAYKLGFTFFASGIAVQGLKITCCIPRPWVIDPSFTPVSSAIEAATGYSFPSCHTQSATALYGTAAFTVKNRWLKAFFVLLALAVGFSRMYLGVHTYFDVGVSLLLTFLIAACVCLFYEKISAPKNDLKVMIILAAISVFLPVYAFILMKIGHSDPAQIDGCFKTGGAGLAFAVGYFLERRYVRFDPKSGSLIFQAVKLIIGIACALFFKSVVKLFLPDAFIFDLIRYFLTVFWVVYVYPLIFTAVQNRKKTD